MRVSPTGNQPKSRSILTVYQASPLSYQTYKGEEKKLDGIDLESEEFALTEELEQFDIDVVCKFATARRLGEFLSQGHKFLHFSCHGHPNFLFIETEYGGSQLLGVDDNLKAWIKAGGNNLNFVFVSACHSRSAGEIFVDADVEHVVCCEKNNQLLSNTAAIVFARGFYGKLAAGSTIQRAFDLAIHDVMNSHELREAGLDPKVQASKFTLLPKGKNHDVALPFDEISPEKFPNSFRRTLSRSELVPVPPQTFIDRRMDMYLILKAMFVGKSKARLLRLTGPDGIGKVSTAKCLAQYMDKRYMWGELFWLPITNGTGKEGDIISNWEKLFEIFQNDQFPASDLKTMEVYKDHAHSLFHTLHNKRATIFINTTKLSPKAVTKVCMFLDDLFETKNDARVIVIHRERIKIHSENGIGFSVIDREHCLQPLDFPSTVALFGKHCDHVTNYQEFYKMVVKKRCDLTYHYMGGGIPSRTILAARNMDASKYRILMERKGELSEADLPEGVDPRDMFNHFNSRTTGGYISDFEEESEEAPLRSQARVVKRFAPLLLKEGKVYRKSVTTFLRQAVKGEKIDAVIYGKHETNYTVKEDSCWVACGRAAGEFYVLKDKEFHDNYDVKNSKPIKDSSTPQAANLRQQGFLEYKSNRKVWARKVDGQDMNFFRHGNENETTSTANEAYFTAPWDESMRVEQGDYLVMTYPDRSASDGIYRIESSVFGFSYKKDTDDETQWVKMGVVAGAVALSALLAVKGRR